MCNLYQSTPRDRISMSFQVGAPVQDYLAQIAPLRPGPFVTKSTQAQVGQWGLIPPGSRTRKPTNPTTGKPMSTNNARRERLATAPTYRGAWKAGQRCLIPADSFDEPYWGTGKNIWWRFFRADGEPWALAGLWSTWTDFETGEIVPSFTMITQNCDGHPLLALMHKPEKDKAGALLPADQQDKRAVVPLEHDRWDEWLHGTAEQADALIQLPTIHLFRHGAADPAKEVALPIGGQPLPGPPVEPSLF